MRKIAMSLIICIVILGIAGCDLLGIILELFNTVFYTSVDGIYKSSIFIHGIWYPITMNVLQFFHYILLSMKI